MEIGELVVLVNEFSPQARAAAGEQDDPYPEPPVAVEDPQALAERLWPVFGADDDAARARHLDALVAEVALTPRIGADGTLTWTGTDGVLTGCVAALVDLVAAHGWTASGTCAADDCVDVFVRTSARGGRRYCSPTCLNRGRVRAYRARQR